jgi:radical SAM-linked protein
MARRAAIPQDSIQGKDGRALAPMPDGPRPAPIVQRLRVRYAKRGRLRFTSHRDAARAVERAIRRAGIPVAFSAGFSPHPKISYAGAVATGVASEAEYLEIGLTGPVSPDRVRADLDAALPTGLDIVDVVELGTDAEHGVRKQTLLDQLEASLWRIRLDGVEPAEAERAVLAFLDAEGVEVERLTKKGRRRFDVRAAVVACAVDRRAMQAAGVECAILRIIVRHMTPAVRPDDVLTGMRQVASLSPPSPPMVTRLAQGPLGADGEVADPLDPAREAAPAARVRAEAADSTGVTGADVVGAWSRG